MQLQNEKIQITLKAQGAEMTSWKYLELNSYGKGTRPTGDDKPRSSFRLSGGCSMINMYMRETPIR